MGTPCKCCGKIVCESRLIRFDHDRYNYDDVVGFAKVGQKIEHKVDGGTSKVVYDSTDNPEFCPSDNQPIACNLEIIDIENTTINSVPVQITTTTTIERKFALAVPINDVYDWGEKNSKGHEFIYSKYIRAGDTFDQTSTVPSCANVPGAGANRSPEMRGEVRILKSGGRSLPASIQEWENQKNTASRPVSFTGDSQKEIGIDRLNEVDGNGTYILLVECPEENSKAEWGTWFGGTDDEVNDTALIELRRITDLEVCDGSQSFPAFKNHDINGPDDLDDWHEDFMRVADGDYRSLKTFMDTEVNFGAFFGADYLEKYFLFCGKLHFGFFQGSQPYLDALYEIAYNRDDKHLLEVEFPDECPPDSVVGEDSPIVAEIIDPVTNETKQIKKLKSFLGAAPTDIMPTSCPDDGCGSKYVDGIYQYTPEQDENIHRFRYKITGGEDRFNGADYVIDEMRTNFISCDKIKPLSDSKNDDTCTATYFTKECATEISGAETKDVGIPKKAIRRGPDLLNGWFIRPCVIESSAAAIPTQTGSTRRIYNKDIYQQYLFVPHYGDYDPATINFKIEDHEFYPYILKINDINDECPKECLPTEHAPEWNVSSSFCSQTPAKINYKEYGTQGGAVDRHITRSFDHFECGAILQSCRQLQDCMGSYAESTSFSMVTNVFKAGVGSVWAQGTDGVCHYPRCNSYHRNGEGPSCGSLIWELTNQTLDETFDWFLLSDPQDCGSCLPQKPSLDDITPEEIQDFMDNKPVTRTTDCTDPNSSHLDDSDAFPNMVGCKGAGGRGGGGGGDEDDSERDSILAQARSNVINSPGDTTGPDNGFEGRTSTCLDGGSLYTSQGKDFLMIGSHNVCEQGNCGVCGLYCNGILVGLDGESTIVVNQTDPNANPDDPPKGDHFYHYNGPKDSAYFCYNLDLAYQKQMVPQKLGCCTTTLKDGSVEKEDLVTKKYCDNRELEKNVEKSEWDDKNECCPEDKGCCTIEYIEGYNPGVGNIPSSGPVIVKEGGYTKEECEFKESEDEVNTTTWKKTDDGECPEDDEDQIGFCCECVDAGRRLCDDRGDTPEECHCNEIKTTILDEGSHEANEQACGGIYERFTQAEIDDCKNGGGDLMLCLRGKANPRCNEQLEQPNADPCCKEVRDKPGCCNMWAEGTDFNGVPNFLIDVNNETECSAQEGESYGGKTIARAEFVPGACPVVDPPTPDPPEPDPPTPDPPEPDPPTPDPPEPDPPTPDPPEPDPPEPDPPTPDPPEPDPPTPDPPEPDPDDDDDDDDDGEGVPGGPGGPIPPGRPFPPGVPGGPPGVPGGPGGPGVPGGPGGPGVPGGPGGPGGPTEDAVGICCICVRDDPPRNPNNPCDSNTTEVFVLTSDSHQKNRDNCIRNPNLPGVPFERFISYTEVTEEHRIECRTARSRRWDDPLGCPDPFPLGENVMSDPEDDCSTGRPVDRNPDGTFCDERGRKNANGERVQRTTKCYKGSFNDCLIDLLGIECVTEEGQRGPNGEPIPEGSNCCVNPRPEPDRPGDPQRPNPGGPGGVDVVQDDQDNPDVPDEPA